MASQTTLATSPNPTTFYHIRHKSLPPLSTTIHPSHGLPSPPATPEDASARPDQAGLSQIPDLEDGAPDKTRSSSGTIASALPDELVSSGVSDSPATFPVSAAPSVLERVETRPGLPLGTPTSLIPPECPELERGRYLGGGLPVAALVDMSGEMKNAGPKSESGRTFSCWDNEKSGSTYQEVMAAVTSCRDGGADSKRIEVSEEGAKKDKNQKEGKRRRIKWLFATSCVFLSKVINPKGGKIGRGYSGAFI